MVRFACPFSGDPCVDRRSSCTNCSVFSRLDPKGEWICAFCVVGNRDAWEGVAHDVLAPGAHAAGMCARCGNERICLTFVTDRRVG